MYKQTELLNFYHLISLSLSVLYNEVMVDV